MFVFREILQLMNHYESLVSEIQDEVKKYRTENRDLRENFALIIEENNRLRIKGDEDPIAALRTNYIDVADKIFNNLRNQLTLCYKVKKAKKSHFIYLINVISGKRNV
jgi:regulator of replication initiation timing